MRYSHTVQDVVRYFATRTLEAQFIATATLGRASVTLKARSPEPGEVLYFLFPISAFLVWAYTLGFINVMHMTDLGLVSVMPYTTIVALLLMMISFCINLQRPQLRVSLLILHIVLLVVMLYGLTYLVEGLPDISTVYRHAGYTEYIMRNGSVNPDLDTYFDWPVFFILGAFVTKIAGFQSALQFAGWAPIFFNLLFLLPIALIYSTFTTNKRLIWLGLWIFALTNWIEQDAYLPQAMNFFLYLVMIAILLKWFKIPRDANRVEANVSRPPMKRGMRGWMIGPLRNWLAAPEEMYEQSSPAKQVALLVIMLAIFAFDVSSHPLTPFFVIASVTALVIFRRCKPFWLPIVMIIMNTAWILTMARPFLVGHSAMVTGSLFHLFGTISVNVTGPASEGSPEHIFIIHMRLLMTLLVWALAGAGILLRLRQGHRDTTFLLLALVPFSLLIAQSYGGEMLLRIYLFTLPYMAFFAASIFFTRLAFNPSKWMTLALIAICVLLISGFLFTRYGNEREDFMTPNEVNGVHYLYKIAPTNSLLIEAWDGAPWYFQDYEKYTYVSLAGDVPNAVPAMNTGAIINLIHSIPSPQAYLLFTRSEQATAELSSGLPHGILIQFEQKLLASGQFKLIYNQPGVQILQYNGSTH
jgi:hypothetical protein